MKYKVSAAAQNLMAKALYDNMPESPEELAFRKGDILTVIEQNTGGLEGWWLCSLHGRQGIAPGNRLKLLIGPMFEAQSSSAGAAPQSSPQSSAYQHKSGSGGAQGIYQVPPSLQSPQQSIYQVPPAQDVYQVPPRTHLAADNPANKVVTPTRVGQSYSYSPGQHNQQDVYDVPPSRSEGVYDIPPAQMYVGQHRNQGVYDVPPSQMDARAQGVYDVPPPSQGVYSLPPGRTNPALQEGNYDFPQPLKHKQEGIYDVPPPALTRTSPSPQAHYDFPPNAEAVSHPPTPQRQRQRRHIRRASSCSAFGGGVTDGRVRHPPRCAAASAPARPGGQRREQEHLRHPGSGRPRRSGRHGRREQVVLLEHRQLAQQHVHLLVFRGLRLREPPGSGRGRCRAEVVPPPAGRGGLHRGSAFHGLPLLTGGRLRSWSATPMMSARSSTGSGLLWRTLWCLVEGLRPTPQLCPIQACTVN
ncbi:hypothetical protein fugu_018453 [Takifugu bimaculatus]|uniref:SH3 domain-containing protein n=1 Tax=Takifugu bimaculatus TaxID=433685 RepID=A0A4Z2BL47_9TELE|nr:hypothetical protein fugu_018453 [Takifugu bimaculatus]